MAIAYRQAALADAAEIHALLLRVADEIPLLVDTLEREEALYALVRNCARSGESWVALDAAERIVGVVLAEPNERGRHYAENEVIEMRHAAVAPEHRSRGVFAGLIEKVLSRMVPVTATVPPLNRSELPRRLEGFGFKRTGSRGGELHFRREPGTLD